MHGNDPDSPLRRLIHGSAELSGAAVGGALGFFAGGPAGAAVLGAAGLAVSINSFPRPLPPFTVISRCRSRTAYDLPEHDPQDRNRNNAAPASLEIPSSIRPPVQIIQKTESSQTDRFMAH